MTDDDLLDRFEREFKEFSESGRSVVFPTMNGVQSWALFCGLQLALKHPDNKGPLSKIQRATAELLERYLTEGYPAMAEVARRGWRE